MAGVFLTLGQLADHGRLGVDVRQFLINGVDALVFLNQRHGGFLAHARHAGDIVGGIAHQGLEIDHVNRVEAVLLAERSGRHVLGGGLSHAGGYQFDLGMVGNELQAVLIAGHHHTLPALRLALAGDGTDQVVRLITCHLIAGDVHGVQHLFQHRHLHRQLFRHPLALGLVVLVCLMAEGGLAPVKGDAQRLRLLLLRQALQGGQKAENGMGI